MGQSDSKQKIEEEFQIHRIQANGNTLLKNKKDDKDYLMRIVSCSSQNDLDRLKTLLESRAQIKNNHLLSLVEIKQKQQDFICSIQYKMYLVLEYSFKNTALQIKERTKTNDHTLFQESDLWSILYSCCTGLQALYSNSISHECLTADQIFINKQGFVKISEPLLFGLQKNHLQAMRTKQQGHIGVHLSPQIMNCLEDQNFFYYQKQKSDIFILAMIVVDLALLENNFLYDAVKKKPNLDLVPRLLAKVGERYSPNLTSILAEMLRIDSKSRPNLIHIIDRVEKCNNIGDDFTLQTESNLKSNDASSEKELERQTLQKPTKYKDLQIKETFLDQSSNSKPPVNRVIIRIAGQPSLSINDQSQNINQNNFDGRVFNITPHPSYFTTQGVTSNYYGSIPTPQSNQPYQNVQNFRKSFDLYQRSKSIDSIKVISHQFQNKLEQLKEKAPNSAVKTSPFTIIEANMPPPELPRQQDRVPKPSQGPIFTHQIPQVYSLLIKNSKAAPNSQFFTKQQKNVILAQQHVSTPQFNGEIAKVNRFTSFKNLPHETVSRFSEDKQPSEIHQTELKRTNSHTQSQTNRRQIPKKHSQLDNYARNTQSPNIFPSNITFMPPQQPKANQFSASAAYPSQLPPGPFVNSSAGSRPINTTPTKSPFNAVSAVSRNMSPSKSQFLQQSQSYTCRSGFNHLAQFKTPQNPDLQLQYVKEDIPERGRYEGYKSNNQRNGHGILYFKDGGHYEGQWKQDKMHGFGKLYYENLAIAYQGHWENDEFNGQGRVYNMQPIPFHQDFNYKDFSELGNRWIYYDGQFKNDSKHGKGYIKLTNGQMFQGVFDHDMIEGNGVFYKRSGEIVIGFWIDNKLFLNQSYQNEKK